MKAIIGISKRHLHLTEETFKKLFGDIKLEVRNYIGQPGQFASTLKVDLKWHDKVIEGVRIVGPFRNQNQIEIALSDAKELGLNPPKRMSGDLEGSLPIILVGPLGEVNIDAGLILAEPHIHLTTNEANNLNVITGDLIEVVKEDEVIFKVQARVDNEATPEVHIDNDEAEELNLKSFEEVEIRKPK